MWLGERKNCFHGHHKTKATAGNRASTFRQQPFVFPSAEQTVGGINAALPVGVYLLPKAFPLRGRWRVAPDEVELL